MMTNSQSLSKNEEVVFPGKIGKGGEELLREWQMEEDRGEVVGRKMEQKSMPWTNCKKQEFHGWGISGVEACLTNIGM